MVLLRTNDNARWLLRVARPFRLRNDDEERAVRVDLDGRLVCVRGRQIHMTREDVAAFLVALAEAIPVARFFDRTKIDEGLIPELSRDAPEIPDDRFAEVEIFFHKESWEPKIIPSSLEWRNYTLANGPQLHANISPSTFGYSVIKEVGRKITTSTSGLLNANHFADDRDGKRIIDKMFRIHRKMVDNHTVIVDLRTGDVVRDEKNYDWYGPDFAKQCQMKKDHYLEVTILRDQDIFWGHLPVM